MLMHLPAKVNEQWKKVEKNQENILRQLANSGKTAA